MYKAEPGFWDLPLERRDNKPLPSQDGMPGQFLGSTVKERTRYVLSIIHILEASAENLICLFSLFGLPHFPFFSPTPLISWGTPCRWWGDVLHCLSRRLNLFRLYSECVCRCLRDSGEIFFSFMLLTFQTELQCHKAGRDSGQVDIYLIHSEHFKIYLGFCFSCLRT